MRAIRTRCQECGFTEDVEPGRLVADHCETFETRDAARAAISKAYFETPQIERAITYVGAYPEGEKP